VLSRQKLPVIDRTKYAPAALLEKGAYVLADSSGKPDLILIASGSEVHIGLEAAKRLAQAGVAVRVVSMPSWALFEKMPEEYKESVLPSNIRYRIAIEAGVPMGWERYIGETGKMIGIERFGASAPGGTVMERFGFSAENIVETALDLLKKK